MHCLSLKSIAVKVKKIKAKAVKVLLGIFLKLNKVIINMVAIVPIKNVVEDLIRQIIKNKIANNLKILFFFDLLFYG